MKTLIIGIAVGLIVGIGGTLLIYQPGEGPVRGLETAAVTEPARGRSDSIRGDDQLLTRATDTDRKSTRLNSSHIPLSRMPSSA